jgi:hypothetical protein
MLLGVHGVPEVGLLGSIGSIPTGLGLGLGLGGDIPPVGPDVGFVGAGGVGGVGGAGFCPQG